MSGYKIISYVAPDLPKQYEGFLYNRWLKSLRDGCPWFNKIDKPAYFKNYHPYVTKILNNPDTIIRLAVLADDHDVALGFSIYRKEILDYIHVHKDYRNNGIGRSLWPSGISTVSHLTAMGDAIRFKNEKYRHLIFNPFA